MSRSQRPGTLHHRQHQSCTSLPVHLPLRSTTGNEMQRSTNAAVAALQQTAPLVLLLLLNVLPLLSAHPTIIEHERPECAGCGDSCHQCKYGSELSRWCGVRECLKGPGEMCGGTRNKYGDCGDGMFCRCNKCTGCSVETLECFSGFCPETDQQSLGGGHQHHLLSLEK